MPKKILQFYAGIGMPMHRSDNCVGSLDNIDETSDEPVKETPGLAERAGRLSIEDDDRSGIIHTANVI